MMTTTNQNVIDPVPVELLEMELTPDRLLRDTNKGGNKIYIIDAFSAPNVMREVGRLREIAFRAAGGGTGKDCDIDEFDTMEPPCRQLVVWDPEAREIIGGYRFIPGNEIKMRSDGMPRIATSHMFSFSERFLKDYLPHTIELGRSFVRLEYQTTRVGVKALYALDNLWDGLGALSVINPEIRYFFGKVTMYPSYLSECRDMILHFYHKYFPDPDCLVTPINPLRPASESSDIERMFCGGDFREDYKILNKAIRDHGLSIPPLVNSYMNLSPTMRCFGTAVNTEFGDVEETGILVTIDDIFDTKKQRHIDTYRENLSQS